MSFFKKKISDDPKEPILVASISNTVLSGMYQDILKSHNIPFLCRNQGAGGYIKVLTGGFLIADNIYVKKSDFENAKNLYNTYIENNHEFENLDEEAK